MYDTVGWDCKNVQHKPYRTTSFGTVAVWKVSINVADIHVRGFVTRNKNLKSKSSGMLRRDDFMFMVEKRQTGNLEIYGIEGVSGMGRRLVFITF